MASNTEIANKAISHLGIQKAIGDLDTTNSSTANSIRLHYVNALKETLRAFDWPFAGRYVTLGLVTDDSTADYEFAYRYPSDCLKVRKIQLLGDRSPTNDKRIPYIIGGDDAGLLIYTTIADASIWYTTYASDPSRYPEDFIMAFAAKLAWLAAPAIIGGNYQDLRKEVAQFYDLQLKSSRATALNEQQPDAEDSSICERART